jgi:hypothetical protein
MSELAFKITVKGGASPDTLRLTELATLLNAIEKAIISIADEEGEEEEDLLVSLRKINKGSAALFFGTNRTIPVIAAYMIFAKALADSTVSELPLPAQEAALTLREYSAIHKTPIRFHQNIKTRAAFYEIKPSSAYELVHPPILKSETTLYGKLERVGGATPRARIRLLNGHVISCSLTADLAKKIAPHLYEVIGIEGAAHYDMASWNVVSFDATGILPYRETSISDALLSLHSASPSAWQDVQDVPAVIRIARGEQ